MKICAGRWDGFPLPETIYVCSGCGFTAMEPVMHMHQIPRLPVPGFHQHPAAMMLPVETAPKTLWCCPDCGHWTGSSYLVHGAAPGWRPRCKMKGVGCSRPEMMPMEVVPAVEVKRLREGLLECARVAGADVSDGIPSWPDIVSWAVGCVRELRADYEQ